MPAEQRARLPGPGGARPRGCTAITFEARVEPLFERAAAVVAMGGYNTFCEILSFGKPALLVPRTTPAAGAVPPRRAGRTAGPGADAGQRRRARPGAAWPTACASCRACRCSPDERSRHRCCRGSSGSPTWSSPGSARATRLPELRAQPLRVDALARRVAILVKGYPRLSETFIAQEILALERLGLPARDRLAAPPDRRPGPRAAPSRSARPVLYLPEYLYQEPLRVLAALARPARRCPFWRPAADLAGAISLRDPTRQPRPAPRPGAGAGGRAAAGHRAAFTPTTSTRPPRSPATRPSCVDLPFSISAHAKDVWTIPDWEKREKLAAARWLVTCSADESRPSAGTGARKPSSSCSTTASTPPAFRPRPGCRAATAATRTAGPSSSCVARAVEKKGLDVLLAALAPLAARPALALRAYRRRPARATSSRPRQRSSASPDRVDLARRRHAGRGAGGPARAPTCSALPPGSPATATATACPT